MEISVPLRFGTLYQAWAALVELSVVELTAIHTSNQLIKLENPTTTSRSLPH